MKDDRIAVAANRLAVRFTEQADLPVRYRKRTDDSDKARRGKEGTEIEKRFQASVKSWTHMIEIIISKLDPDQAWRFMELRPNHKQTISRVTDDRDFCDLIDYMAVRRDVECCGPDEIGCLAQLSVAFQREVERNITA